MNSKNLNVSGTTKPFIFYPSFMNPNYGINDRQTLNSQTDSSIDLITPFLKSMIRHQKQNQQAIAQPKPQLVIITRSTQPKPQVIITQTKQPKPKPTSK